MIIIEIDIFIIIINKPKLHNFIYIINKLKLHNFIYISIKYNITIET